MGRTIAADPKRNVPLIDTSKAPEPSKQKSFAPKDLPPAVRITHDPVSEGVIIAASAQDATTRTRLARSLFTDQFLTREHAIAWGAILELERQKLAFDIATIEKLSGYDAARTIERCMSSIPDAKANIDFHVGTLKWDHAKATAIAGPFTKLLEAFKDGATERATFRSLTKQLASSFDGYEDRQWVHDPKVIVAEQMRDIEARVDGRAIWPYGIEGLDYFNDRERDGELMRRMIPGAAPGQITCVTAISGGGKSTFTAHIALGLARLGRRVLWGAWEVKGGMNLELLACISLGWSRQDLTEGKGFIASREGRIMFEERMHAIAASIRFLKNPFRRRGDKEKRSNSRNLDLLHGILSDEACDVFIADLWKRCLAQSDPDEEEEALISQQAMAEELNQHHILLQQQRLKDIEQRPDKRPTREGIKGSGAWIEIPDTIIGLHRPALWKKIEDDRLEAFVLKQRFGKWPLGVEFKWSAEHGSIDGGRSIDYDRPGEGNEVDAFTAAGSFLAQKPGGRRKK